MKIRRHKPRKVEPAPPDPNDPQFIHGERAGRMSAASRCSPDVCDCRLFKELTDVCPCYQSGFEAAGFTCEREDGEKAATENIIAKLLARGSGSLATSSVSWDRRKKIAEALQRGDHLAPEDSWK